MNMKTKFIVRHWRTNDVIDVKRLEGTLSEVMNRLDKQVKSDAEFTKSDWFELIAASATSKSGYVSGGLAFDEEAGYLTLSPIGFTEFVADDFRGSPVKVTNSVN